MSYIREKLNSVVDAEWVRIQRSACWQHCVTDGTPRVLYQQIMVQIYHYTRYNSINQAQAAALVTPEQRGLLRFVYKHALEELGHEAMVIHDLKSVDLLPDSMPAPLPATAALVGYLNYVASVYGAIARLGYSFWAEQCYGPIAPLLQSFRSTLGLSDKEMSFFVSHSEIDSKHSEEVNKVIDLFCKTDADAEKIIEVARTTLYLTGRILDDAFDVYCETQDRRGMAA